MLPPREHFCESVNTSKATGVPSRLNCDEHPLTRRALGFLRKIGQQIHERILPRWARTPPALLLTCPRTGAAAVAHLRVARSTVSTRTDRTVTAPCLSPRWQVSAAASSAARGLLPVALLNRSVAVFRVKVAKQQRPTDECAPAPKRARASSLLPSPTAVSLPHPICEVASRPSR